MVREVVEVGEHVFGDDLMGAAKQLMRTCMFGAEGEAAGKTFTCDAKKAYTCGPSDSVTYAVMPRGGLLTLRLLWTRVQNGAATRPAAMLLI